MAGGPGFEPTLTESESLGSNDDIRLGRIASSAEIVEWEAQGERHIRLFAPLTWLCRHYFHSRTRWSQSREPSQVLRGRREEEFVFGAAWAPQPQAPDPKDALEMGK
jgi:hypothetical protein